MKGFLNHLLLVIAGLLSGATLVLVALYLWPFAFEDRTALAIEQLEASGGRTESFFLQIPADTVLVTHGGGFPFQPIPEGIAYTGQGRTPGTLALVSKFRHHPDGEVIAFGTELEISHADSRLLAGKLMTHTLWSIVVPGRGVLHLYQLENNWRLMKKVILPMMLSGEPFRGEHRGVNTYGPLPGYHGRIVGGSGEFAGASGRFIEIGTLHEASPDGRIKGLMELRISFDNR